MTLQVQTAASGVARSAHYVIPTGQTQPTQTLLLEPQRTNLCIRSEEFNTWDAIGSTTVTANAIAAPDGTTTADLITCSAAGPASAGRYRAVTFTGDGEKCVAIYLKVGNGAETRLLLQDATAAVTRHHVRVIWTAGVPAINTNSGAGTLYPVEALANGWYRILFSVTGIVAANTNEIRIYVNNIGAGVTGDSVYAWGAQAENAVVPSSYIKTEGTTVTRNADSLYFPFTAPPQAMTVYVRGVARESYVNTGAERRALVIGASSLSGARFEVTTIGGGTSARTRHHNGTTETLSGATPSPTIVRGDVEERRAVLRADGSTLTGITRNAGTEVTGTSAALALAVAWSDTRINLTGGLSAGNMMFAYTHVIVTTGEQSLATMRQLAGVV